MVADVPRGVVIDFSGASARFLIPRLPAMSGTPCRLFRDDTSFCLSGNHRSVAPSMKPGTASGVEAACANITMKPETDITTAGSEGCPEAIGAEAPSPAGNSGSETALACYYPVGPGYADRCGWKGAGVDMDAAENRLALHKRERPTASLPQTRSATASVNHRTGTATTNPMSSRCSGTSKEGRSASPARREDTLTARQTAAKSSSTGTPMLAVKVRGRG